MTHMKSEKESTTMTGKADPAPFKDLKVLDFTWAGAGSFCVNYFAWYGATVVKLENKKRPDITRTAPPYKDGIPGLERSLYFAWTHPAKKFDITLNLNHAKGVEIAKKLVQWSDVIVESFVAGTLEKWGLGYDDIKEINPQVIMLRTCTHGQTGTLAKQPDLGFILATLSGFNNLTGWPDRECNEAHGAYTDFITPLFGALALTAAFFAASLFFDRLFLGGLFLTTLRLGALLLVAFLFIAFFLLRFFWPLFFFIGIAVLLLENYLIRNICNKGNTGVLSHH